MCFLRKRTTKNIDRIENESDELRNLFDEKMPLVPISVCRALSNRLQIIMDIETSAIVGCSKIRRNSL